MKVSPKLATTVILLTVVSAWLWRKPDSDIRFFCSHDRVFIEFEENGKVWGTTWVDDDGKPLSCSEVVIPKTKSSTTINII